MLNKSREKTPMPTLSPGERAGSFCEVATGYTREQAAAEAARCLGCKHKPCVGGCPVSVDIPAFIAALACGDEEGAYEIIRRTNSLPAVCGRVCPQETQCERLCLRGIKDEPVAIGRLERYAADRRLSTAAAGGPSVRSAGRDFAKKVAVVGSGPAGLTCAGELIGRGIGVTIFEAMHLPGGVLSYGIPEFRLPKAIVAAEIEGLVAGGVVIERNVIVGRTLSIEDLLGREGFSAVFIGSGAGLPVFLGIEGENLNGVYSANEFLTRINLMRAYDEGFDTPVKRHRRVGVIGGGNVAMDAARCAVRLGAEVTVIYRRGEEELPARREEVLHAREEGVGFAMLTAPLRLLGDDGGWVRAAECIRMELGEPDASGRRRPVPIEGSGYELPLDCVIAAVGTTPNPLIGSGTPGLERDRRGCIVADPESCATSIPGVYAGGDITTGAATVILAMGAGRKAAAAICGYLGAE